MSSVVWDMNEIVGTSNILLMTLDTLRFDVAQTAYDQGRIPTLAKWIPNGWQRRHSPANFTYAAHHAFFSGFLPTPIDHPQSPRLFATEFPGSETTTTTTCQFKAATIVEGLAEMGYQTHCIGGVGFFNKLTPLGSVLPDLFQYSYWSEDLGVTCKASPDHQVALIEQIITSADDQLLFVFANIAAMHQPNCIYLDGAECDGPESQLAALVYVDGALKSLFQLMEDSGNWFVIVCADHGTAYGEDGYIGHRLNHPVVGDVPYADFLIEKAS